MTKPEEFKIELPSQDNIRVMGKKAIIRLALNYQSYIRQMAKSNQHLGTKIQESIAMATSLSKDLKKWKRACKWLMISMVIETVGVFFLCLSLLLR